MASAPTVLGLPGAWAGDALEACTHYTTKVGGVPAWPPGAEALLQDGQQTCQACGRRLGLLVQAYAPLSIEGREIPERTLYVFGCLSPDCGHDQKSWRVLRVQREDSGVKAAEAASQATTLDTSNDDPSATGTDAQSWWQDDSWGGGADERGTRAANRRNANEGTDDENREETDARSRTLGTSPEAPSFSEQSTAENAASGCDHAELEAGGDGQRQVSDAHERTGSHASNNNWGDDTWGAPGTSEWGTDGPALDMNALSKAIAQVADSANRKAERNKMTSAGPTGEEEDGGGGSRQGGGVGPDASGTSAVTSSVLPCFYVLAAEEPLEKKRKEAQMKTVDEGPREETWEGEGYEYDSALSADRTFLRFRKRVERAPEQCIRYGFNSQPLLARALTDPPQPCTACAAPRTFEMQLMPPLPYFLAGASEEAAGQVAGWEWLTLLVYTCSQACYKPTSGIHVALVEETLVYQHELESTRS